MLRDLNTYSVVSLNQTKSNLHPSISKYSFVISYPITSWKHIDFSLINNYFKSFTYINYWSNQNFFPFQNLTKIYSGSRIICNSCLLFFTVEPESSKNFFIYDWNVSNTLRSSILIQLSFVTYSIGIQSVDFFYPLNCYFNGNIYVKSFSSLYAELFNRY